MNCRFVVIGNSIAYTTANEIGAFLMSKGVKFKAFSNDSNSYHFGTVFNERLITGIKKAIGCGGNVSYTINDFPKLIYNKEDNNEMIQYLIDNNLCTVPSTAIVQKGTTERALDLYTLDALKALIVSYGKTLQESDIEILPRTFLYTPYLKPNYRIEQTTSKNTSHKKALFSI